jgi:outer membrane autotransporter protein
MEGVSLVGGLSKHFMDQRLMLGAFGEYGDGKYNTLDTIIENNLGDVTSRGIISYVGDGILGRLKIDNIYVDVSVRAGNSSGDFNSCDMGIDAQEEVKYNYEVMYYGAHLGCGYILKLGNKFSVDVNGKFLLTHQEGKNIMLSTQDNVAFSQANLGKIRLGVRSGYKLLNVLTQYSDLEHEHMKEVETKAKEAGVCVEDLYTSKYTLTPYLGLGYEYEFFGKIEAKSTDLDIPVVDLKGGNAIGEIGLTSTVGQFNIDCSVFGYK